MAKWEKARRCFGEPAPDPHTLAALDHYRKRLLDKLAPRIEKNP